MMGIPERDGWNRGIERGELMGYSREVYDAAEAELARRRSVAQAKAATMRDRITARNPRAREIEQEMAHSAIQVARAVLDGGDVEKAVERIKTQNLSLQAELAELLASEGVHAANFEPQYQCPYCQDTGFVKSKPCECFRALVKAEACRRSGQASTNKKMSFKDLRFDYYPDNPDSRTGVVPRVKMKEVLTYCRCYAEDFDLQSRSLLLYGPTGTGKTHVSLAISYTVIDRGYGVIYGPAQTLLHKLEKEHFGRVQGNSEEAMTSCDLLVIDDLGAEFSSSFYTSCLYNLINGRMLEGRPTIISTNLNQSELMERYGEQITSRIIGTFVPLTFVGKDIRQILLQQQIR
jgi:DNA replication protein DnaC